MTVKSVKPKQLPHKCKLTTIFSQQWTNGIHGVIQYLLPQTNEDQNEKELSSTVLWKWGGMTQTKTNTTLDFTSQLDLLVEPTPIPCSFVIIGRVTLLLTSF